MAKQSETTQEKPKRCAKITLNPKVALKDLRRQRNKTINH